MIADTHIDLLKLSPIGVANVVVTATCFCFCHCLQIATRQHWWKQFRNQNGIASVVLLRASSPNTRAFITPPPLSFRNQSVLRWAVSQLWSLGHSGCAWCTCCSPPTQQSSFRPCVLFAGVCCAEVHAHKHANTHTRTCTCTCTIRCSRTRIRTREHSYFVHFTC
jgi:hypothetical protein